MTVFKPTTITVVPSSIGPRQAAKTQSRIQELLTALTPRRVPRDQFACLVRRITNVRAISPSIPACKRFCRPGRDSVAFTLLPHNRPAFRLNSISPVTLFPQLCRETRRPLRAPSLPKNPVTARIFMKTIIKPRMPFFPSCIMDLGALASPECAVLRRHSRAHMYSCARGSASPCRLPRLGSLTIE
jgi:hypothetical protein